METLWQDVKYGMRMLAKDRGLTLMAVITLALGIGANTAIFSIVNAVLLKPLSFSEPDRIVSVLTAYPGRGVEKDIFSPPNFLDLEAQSSSLEAAGAFSYSGVTFTGQDEPIGVTAAAATAGFFPALGVQPALGRVFTREEDQPGRNKVIVLGHGVWMRHFGGDRAIVGRTVQVSGEPHTVLGVMPEGFAFPPGVDAWRPLAITDSQRQARGAIYLDVIGRLKAGIPFEAALAEIQGIGQRLEKDYPQANAGMQVYIKPLMEELVGEVRRGLLVISGAVGFVLLVVCVNLANLLLSSATSRQREFAVRAALGAPRARLIRQMLTESVLLALAGGVMGWLLALWAQPILVSLAEAGAQTNIPRLEEVRLDRGVFLFTLGISLFCGLGFGLLPALAFSRRGMVKALKEASRGSAQGGSGRRAGSVLIVSQVALVLVLLVGAGLMVNSFARLRAVDPGFRTERVVSLQVFLPSSRYSQPPALLAFHRDLLERLRALPGVESAALVNPAPIGAVPMVFDLGFSIAGKPDPPPEQERVANATTVSPGYFETMGIRLLRGRGFGEQDHESAPGVMVISETLARRYFEGEDPLGQRIIVGRRQPRTFEVVGVVADVRRMSLSAAYKPEFYIPFAQLPRGQINFVVRTKGEPSGQFTGIKAALWAVDRNLPARYLNSMDELVSRSLAEPRMQAVLMAAFAGLAMLLAAVGIYGVIAHSVGQRTQEIGVRMALGAQQATVLRMILAEGARLAGLGLSLGLAASLALTHFLQKLLYEVSPYDAPTYLAVGLLLLAVTVLACWVPARRATRVDPLVALRYE